MRVTDSRVVKLSFDNKEFEKNVSTSMSTLEKLEQALLFNKSSDGIKKLGDSLKNLPFDITARGIEQVERRFSLMSVAALTAIQNVVNKAADMVERTIKNLTIAPVMEGFGEYELKLDSIQTIMAGTGESLETVSEYLDELNKYADKTVYSFSDMTNNIGKFTNAGVELETAVAAIQGISNAAALAGANATNASHAMYNFAQAIASGYVGLVDWKSIEVANMATKEFKQQLIDTAVSLGTLVKVGEDYQSVTTDNNGSISQAFNATKLFNASLSSQWMTTEVLTTTLAKYSDETTELGKQAFAAAQDIKTFTQLMSTLKEAVGSGWAQSFEIIVGNFDEAKRLWTGVSQAISDIINRQAQARNKLLSDFVDLGGREEVIKALSNAWKILTSIVDAAREAIVAFFAPLTGGILAQAAKDFSDVIGKLSIFQNKYDTVTHTITKSNEYAKVANDVLRGLWGDGQERIDRLTEAGYDYNKVQELVNQGWQDETESIERVTKTIRKQHPALRTLTKIFKTVSASAAIVSEAITQVYDGIKTIVRNQDLGSIGASIEHIVTVFYNWVLAQKRVFEATKPFQKFVESYFSDVVDRVKDIVDALKGFGTVIVETLSIIDEQIEDTFGSGILGLAWDAISRVLSEAAELLIDVVLPTISAIIRGVTRLIEKVISSERFITLVVKIVDLLRATWELVKRLITVAGDGLKEIFGNEDIQEKASDVFGGIIDVITEAVIALTDFINGVDFSGNGTFLDSLGENILSFGGILRTVGSAISDFMSHFKFFESLGNIIKRVFNTLSKMGVVQIGALVLIIKELTSAMRTKNALTRGVRGIGNSLQYFSEMLSGGAKMMKAAAFRTMTEGIKNIAESIFILIGAFTIIASLDAESVKTTLKFVGIIAGIVAAIVAIKFIVDKINGKGKRNVFDDLRELLVNNFSDLINGLSDLTKSASMVALFASVNLAVLALYNIAKLINGIGTLGLSNTVEKEWLGILAVLAIFGTILGMVRLSSKSSGAALAGIGIITLTFNSLIKTIAEISKLPNFDQIINTAINVFVKIASLIAVITVLPMIIDKATVIFGGILGKFDIISKSTTRALTKSRKINYRGMRAYVMGVALAVLAMVAAVAIISKIAQTNTKGLIVATGIVAGFAILLTTLQIVASRTTKRTSKFGKNFLGLATCLLAIAVCLRIITNDIANHGVGPVLISVGIIAAMITLVTILSRVKLGANKAQAIAKNFLGISVMLLALALAVKLMSTVDSKSLLLATGMVGAFMVLVAICSIAISRLSKSARTIRASSKLINSISIMMLAIAGAMLILTSLPTGKMLASALMLVGVIGAIVAIGIIGNKIDKKAPKTLSSYAIIIVTIAGSLAVLSMFDMGKILVSAVTLVAVIAALTGISALGKKLGVNPLAGASMVGFAITAVAIAAALSLLSTFDFGSILKSAIVLVAVVGVLTMLSTIASTSIIGAGAILSICVAVLALAGAIFVIEVTLEKFANAAPTMFDKLAESMEGFINFLTKLEDNASTIGEVAGRIGIEFMGGFIGGIIGALPAAINDLIDGVKRGFNAVIQWWKNESPEVGKQVGEIFTEDDLTDQMSRDLDGFSGSSGSVEKSAKTAGKKLGEVASDGLKEGAEEVVNNESIIDVGNIHDLIGGNIDINDVLSKVGVDYSSEDLLNSLGIPSLGGEISTDIGGSLLGGIYDESGNIDIGKLLGNYSISTDNLELSGINSEDLYSNILPSDISINPDDQTSMNDYLSSLVGGATIDTESLLGNGLFNGKTADYYGTEAGEETSQALIDVINSHRAELQTAGESLIDSFSYGIVSKADDVTNSGYQIQNALINGIYGLGAALNKTSNDIRTETLAAIDTAVTDANVEITTEAEGVHPVITPVIDHDAVQKGLDDISRIRAAKDYQLAMGGITNTFDGSSITVNVNNQEVVDEINRLHTDIERLASNMSNLQIVMDTGEIVGVLSPQIDTDIGIRAFRHGRERMGTF